MHIELHIDRHELPAHRNGKLKHGMELAISVQKLIQSDVSTIGHDLAGEGPDFRDDLGTITIDDIQHIKGNRYGMSFTADWHTYLGCRDLDYASEEALHTTFTIDEDGNITFEPQMPRRRSTADEL